MLNVRSSLLVAVMCAAAVSALAKEPTQMVVTWPSGDHPALKLTLDRFRVLSTHNGTDTYTAETTVQNLTEKPIAQATFTVYFLDKQKVRIGAKSFPTHHIDPGQQVKAHLQFYSVGTPATADLQVTTVPRIADLAAPSHDTLELRDGSKLQGDVMSVSMTEVVLMVNGETRKFERNQVRRILLIERHNAPPDQVNSPK